MWQKLFSLILLINFLYCDNLENNQSASSQITNPSQSKSSAVLDEKLTSVTKENKYYETTPIGTIPTWYLQNRVQILAALFERDMNRPIFFNLPKQLADLGATVVTRQIKGDDEQPWWPSQYGTMLPEAKSLSKNGKNLAQELIDQMHDLGMKAIIYYRHMEDSQMLASHPDWACLDINGKIISTKRGQVLSINSPYRNVVIQRVKELSLMGADGFYFDETHIPLDGDFSSYSMNLYKKKYGTNMKDDYEAGSIKRFFDFRNESIQHFFDDLRDTLENSRLNPLLIVSGNAWPAFTDLHMTSDFFKRYTLKTELEVPSRAFKHRTFTMPQTVRQEIPAFYLNAFCFSFVRDNSFGPPNVWCPQVKTKDDAEAIAAGLVSLGCIAEMDAGRTTNRTEVINNYKTILSWNKLYGKYFSKMTPYATTGIVVSEYQRNQFINDPQKAWNNALIPSIKAFMKMYDSGLPVRLFSDADLELKDYNSINNIFYTTNIKLPVTNLPATPKFLSLNELEGLNGMQLAQKTGSPIFCEKENNFINVNYFKDDEKNLYIVTAPDFNSVKRDFNEKSKTNLNYRKQANYNKPKNLFIYLKTDKVAGSVLKDIVTNTTINPVKTENGYYVFNIQPGSSALGLYSITLK